MQGLMPFLLAVVCGAAFFSFINHLLIGLKEPKDKVHLLFSGFCLISSLIACVMHYKYQVANAEEFIQIIKLQTIGAAAYYIIQVLFVEAYTGVRQVFFSRAIITLSILFVIVGVFRTEGLYIDSYQGVQAPKEDFWGTHIRFVEPDWSLIGSLSMAFTFAQYFYLAYCCLVSIKTRPERNAAYLLFATSLYYALLVFDIWSLLKYDLTVYFSSLAFLVYIAYMSTHMTLQARQALQQRSEEKYHHLLESVSDDYMFFSCDITGKVSYISPSSQKIVGLTPEELLVKGGEDLADFLVTPKEEVAEAIFSAQIDKDFKLEVEIKTKTHEHVTLDIHIKPLVTDGELVGIEGYARDMTEIKRHEIALGKMNEELEKRVADRTVILEDTLAELRAEIEAKELLERQLLQAQKMESIGQLAGGVAHDFNNIMTAVRGFAEISINEIRKGNDISGDLEQILDAADRGTKLTNQLLGFARKQIAVPRVIQPKEVIVNAVKLLPRLLETNISIHFDDSKDVWPVKIDPVQLDQILINLSVNARDAMPNGGDLYIEIANVTVDEIEDKFPEVIWLDDEYFCLTVRDTGQGMDKELQDKIFEPFFTTKPVGKGSGLGLAVCYGVVKQYQGYIFVKSEPREGTTFYILLPRSRSSVRQASEANLKTDTTLEGGDETILMVEDDASVAMLTERVLRTAGYEVLLASDGLEALDLAEKHSGDIDLIITDIMMPKMNGKELIDAIKLLTPEIGIICLSGYADDEVIAEVIAKGAIFVKKPYTPVALAKTVRAVLDKTAIEKVITFT